MQNMIHQIVDEDPSWRQLYSENIKFAALTLTCKRAIEPKPLTRKRLNGHFQPDQAIETEPPLPNESKISLDIAIHMEGAAVSREEFNWLTSNNTTNYTN